MLHHRFRAQLAEILDEVVRERIVVIDNEEHGNRLKVELLQEKFHRDIMVGRDEFQKRV